MHAAAGTYLQKGLYLVRSSYTSADLKKKKRCLSSWTSLHLRLSHKLVCDGQGFDFCYFEQAGAGF